ncbi:hypothetical protein N7517_007528 [Penicillium concentricum]|uniref:chitinase n=1 Tax=Penicillium concentricum TaxID=293559 RepID=A0A9W9VB60_9EURO|nr:uncharacterized protein N7517_007528 [Penicillium concentricum]KAJ5375522.1 hypothetical protein N7517_007528 [Penicillium concentricum]
MHQPHSFTKLFSFLILLLSFSLSVLAQQDAVCDSETPCKVGCCSKSGSCGFGPDWCSDENCISNCKAVAECGQYGNDKKCPLNVCCSRWGFCGTTEEFCLETDDEEKSCQSNCGQPDRQKCSNERWKQRRIAYYETWADNRTCDAFRPENIPVKALTHLNIAFGGIKDSRVTISSTDMISRIVKLKRRNRSLQVFIAVGGWAFSDPGPTRTAWSDMASSKETRTKFINSLMDLLETFDLDGVDLDWEYPVADDRGGKDADYKNYVTLVQEMRASFTKRNEIWGISMAIPASYWYLQHFDIAALQKEVSWFNLMSYDMRGKWDQFNEWTGPYVFGHTNITEIEQGVDLLRRNNVNLYKVSLGMGFYGRTFTLDDPKCSEPGCVFADAGVRGECSGEEGILTFKEIMARKHRLNEKHEYFDNKTSVKYMVYDETQWITYDDAESFAVKRKMLDDECFGGVMIWAIDQDTPDFQALAGLLGDEFVSDALLEGGELSDDEKEDLVNEMGGLTGDACYVPTGCFGAAPTIEGNPDCRSGDVTVGMVHAPGESLQNLYGAMSHNAQTCAKGTWKRICCPAKTPAINCRWVGRPDSGSKCTGGEGESTCGTGQYELLTDRYADELGETKCSSGLVSFCCDQAPEMQDCHWSPCTVFGTCSTGYSQPIATRGDYCKEGSFQNFCCKVDSKLNNCDWVPAVEKFTSGDGDGPNLITLPTAQECSKRFCPSTQFTASKAKLPNRSAGKRGPCDWAYPGLQHRLCCDPDPDRDLPFDLKKIFPNPIGEDVGYRYTDNYGNNNRDPHGPDETDVGDDPYGFIVLDGDEDALQGEFPSNFEFTHAEDGTGKPIKKRETLSRDDPNLMDWVFEHEESHHLVYCRKGREDNCQRVFQGGAYDTIIGLPAHIGSGPYARIVSMEAVKSSSLSDFHKTKRSLDGHDSAVYNLTIDYRFELIRRADSRVNLRIDYTNLVPYWDEMTGEESDAGSKSKRELRREKRWWGTYTEWLKKLTTVRTSDEGKLPLSIHKKMLLYSRRAQCARKGMTLKAGIDVTLDAKFDMNARWAYYAQGTIVPLNIDTVYTYFELHPEVQAILEIDGSAEMIYRSPRIRIIDTLSYPGLAIKGIAAVGPTLDLYGQMEAGATIAGKLKAGAKMTFPKYEMYFPQSDEAKDYQKFPTPDDSDTKRVSGTDMVPILDASVEASVHIDLMLTPEANLGIKVNAPMVKGGPVLDAQIVGFVNNTLRFQVDAGGSGGIDNPPAASYDVYVKYFYNFGYGGRAIFKWLGEYALKPKTLWSGKGKEKILWEHHGSTSTTKRSTLEPDLLGAERFIPIYNATEFLDDEWDAPTGLLVPRSLHKRKTPEEVAAFGLNKGFFTCNDGGQCKNGGCDGDSCEWKPKPSSLTRRADDDDGDPMDVDSSQSCISSIPAVMYNCRYFPDHRVQDRDIPGICRNVLKFFTDEGLGTGPYTATFHMSKKGSPDKNRKWVCGEKSQHEYTYIDENGEEQEKTSTWKDECVDNSRVLSTLTNSAIGVNGNNNWLSCDEFPWNAMEEGGNPNKNSRMCVPGWQQNMQGWFNSILNYMSQEVTWTDSNDETRTAVKSWGIDWASHGVLGLGSRVDRNTAWNYGRVHEKKFTYHLFNSDSDTAVTGSAYEVFNHKLAQGGDKSDMADVIGAVNTLGNRKYSITKNALCRASGTHDHPFWKSAEGLYVKTVECTVVFDNAAAVAKIKRGEKPTQEEMFNIKRIEIAEDEPVHEIYIPYDDTEPTLAPRSIGKHRRHRAHHS